MLNSTTKTDNDFFSFILINSPIKTFSLVFCCMGIIVVPVLSYGITWYYRNGPDKNSTFLNSLVVSFCFVISEMFITIQLTEIIRQSFGPMPKLFCHIKAIARPVYISQSLLFLDAMAISRYLFIFVLKNPAAFNDRFWIMFLNIWIKLISIIGNTVWSLKADHEVLNYYICTGEDPTESFQNPLKSYGFVEIGSILVHLFVCIRIQVYKHNNKKQLLAVTQGGILKSQFLERVKALSLMTFMQNAIGIAIMVMLLASTMAMGRIEPHKLENHKNFIHIHYLVSLSVPSLVYLTLYYIQHKEMRTFLWNNIPILYRLHSKK